MNVKTGRDGTRQKKWEEGKCMINMELKEGKGGQRREKVKRVNTGNSEESTG